MGFTWLKILVPTTTLTGIVTLPLEARTTIWPTNVPGVRPPPGRLEGTIPTVTNDGAVPPADEIVSQLAPSEVLFVAVQFNVPDPALRICMVWLVGVVLAVISEKLTWPGRLSTMVAPALTIVKVTGIVSTTLPNCEVITTWPVYVPTARAMGAVTTTEIVRGVAHNPHPVIVEAESQLPPELVVADVMLKLKPVPTAAIVGFWGSGSAPPNDLVNDRAGTDRKTCALRGAEATANNARAIAAVKRI
jgi:hypothetical protein